MTPSPALALMFAAGMLSAATAAAQPAATRLTLDEAVALALAHNRTVASAALDVAKADASIATARSRRLPTFRIDAEASQLLRPVEIQFPEGAFGTFDGIAGALATLWLAGSSFGFMAFLGVASLIGVIVSHIIVLFDFIEEMREHGKPLEEALLDAGIVRLRPVLITVAATVIALFPLAAHGGPLWEPMCYAQIGGLTAATFVTLVIVPVIYATSVLDLKEVVWCPGPSAEC